MRPLHHIAIEGAPGSGKTSVATALGKELGARVLLDVGENPFLERYYEEMPRFAFQTQLYYLLSRFQIDEELQQPDLFTGRFITDFLFDRDDIYASITLGADELQLYRYLYRQLVERRMPPDMTIYLQLSAREAIARRSDLDPNYVRLIVDAYNDFFLYYNSSPLIVIRADDFDPVTWPEHMEKLVEEIFLRAQEGASGGEAHAPCERRLRE